MHAGKSYKLGEFLYWTRKNIIILLLIGIAAPVLYEVIGLKWLAIPFTIVGLLGTATAFIITFRNQETYNRTWEARQIWGAVMSGTRSWVMMSRDFFHDKVKSTEMVYRHLAWLTALRYQLRIPKNWEYQGKLYNKEYRKFYSVPEMEVPLEHELSKYIGGDEIAAVLDTNNRATQLLGLQSQALKKHREDEALEEFRFLDMHGVLRELSENQGKAERIKNFPYPRQYATINGIFVKLFCILLPFSLLEEFDRLNEKVSGVLEGNMIWFIIPFSVIVSWVFTSLEQVGESTENPFEGSANDVPISQMSRSIEIDAREMLGEVELPAVLHPQKDIVL